MFDTVTEWGYEFKHLFPQNVGMFSDLLKEWPPLCLLTPRWGMKATAAPNRIKSGVADISRDRFHAPEKGKNTPKAQKSRKKFFDRQLKGRVGRVIGNTTIFCFGLRERSHL